VVFVNGEQQMPCKEKNQPWNEDIGGTIREFRSGANRDYILMDPSPAYPREELKSWRRHIVLDKPAVTVIVDEISCAKGAEIEVRFHSAVSRDIRGNHVVLEGEGSMMCLIPAVQGKYSFRPGRHAILPVDKNSRFRWIPYFGTVVKAEKAVTVIGTVILPVVDDREAEDIAGTVKSEVDTKGNLTVSFVKGGKTFAYTFTQTGDGLLLE